MTKQLITIVHGIFMGVADSIPGVSGATIALMLGIYGKFVNSWSYFFSNLFNFKKLFNSDEFKFLLFLYIGVAIGFLSSLGFIDYLMTHFPNAIFSFFAGLIIGGIIFLFTDLLKKKKEIKNNSSPLINVFSLIIGFSIAFYISGAQFLIMDHSLPIIFFSGVCAMSAMVMPGMSGAFVLLMMNQYSYIVNAVNEFRFSVILVFILGAVVGLAFMSKLLKWLLDKYYIYTMMCLIGLMIGGLRAPILNVNNWFIFVIYVIIGIVSSLLIEWFGRKATTN